MPASKILTSTVKAVADIPTGATIMVAGYAQTGTPQHLVKSLLDRPISGLTCISGPWYGASPAIYDAARLVAAGMVDRIITAPPIPLGGAEVLATLRREGRLEVEIVTEGTLAERIRAGGAGLGGLFLPALEDADRSNTVEETLDIGGVLHVYQPPMRADYCLLKAQVADELGNLVYGRSQRNWNPIMAMAAEVCIVEVDQVVASGDLDPELVITPGIHVDRIVEAPGTPDG